MQREQEEKKHLYRNISRGIRTPLNVVVVGQAALRGQMIETMKRYAGQMNGQIERVMAVLRKSPWIWALMPARNPEARTALC